MFSFQDGWYVVFAATRGDEDGGQLIWCVVWIGGHKPIAQYAYDSLKENPKVLALTLAEWALADGYTLRACWDRDDTGIAHPREDHPSFPSLVDAGYEALGEIAGISRYGTARGWMNDAVELKLIPDHWGRRDRDFPPIAAGPVASAGGHAPASLPPQRP